MAGVTWHRLSSPEDWMEALDRSTEASSALISGIHQAAEARRAVLRRGLDAAVAGLAVASLGESDDVAGLSGRPPLRDGGGGRPYVALPQRTTHGGPFGPVVRAKLRDEAMGRRRW